MVAIGFKYFWGFFDLGLGKVTYNSNLPKFIQTIFPHLEQKWLQCNGNIARIFLSQILPNTWTSAAFPWRHGRKTGVICLAAWKYFILLEKNLPENLVENFLLCCSSSPLLKQRICNWAHQLQPASQLQFADNWPATAYRGYHRFSPGKSQHFSGREILKKTMWSNQEMESEAHFKLRFMAER